MRKGLKSRKSGTTEDRAPRWAVDAVYDIECSQWDQFVCGALWTVAGGVEVYEDPDEMADAILSLAPGSQVWGHAAGKYDGLWLLDNITHRDGKPPKARITTSGASASSIKFTQGPFLRDSARLIPMSLARAAPMAGKGRAKGDPGLPCKCGEDCGGYCSISRKMPRKLWRSLIEYLISDVDLLRDILINVEAFAFKHEIELRGTVGGTAWATAKKWCDLPDAVWKRNEYYLARDGYVGGKCEVGITEASGNPCLWRFDRKSAYPAALQEPLPVGPHKVALNDAAGKAWRAGKPGIYHARVTIPEMPFPPLPHRYKDRLTYPYGQIEGSWSHVELQHAEECGVKIEKIDHAVVWPKEEAVMAPFSKACFELRDGLPKDEQKSLGIFLKFINNSATGKLGQSPEHDEVVLGDFADDPRYSLVGESPWVWSREQWRIPQCGHVQWSATLTARARVELHKQQMHAGDHWAYSDTDSCFATRPLTRRVGQKLGEWAPEGRAKTPPRCDQVDGWPGAGWICLAPKVYAYYDQDSREWIAHAKGVPDGDTFRQWERYAAGETITVERGVYGFRSALAKSDRIFKRRKLTRTLRAPGEWCGARKRVGHVTRPVHVSELATLP